MSKYIYDELSSKLGIGVMVSNHNSALKLVRSMKNLLPYLSKVKLSMVINGKDYENAENLKELLSNIPSGMDYDYEGPIPYATVKEDYFTHLGEDSSLKFLKLRQLSVNKCLDRKYWFIMDDDMTFGGPTEKNPANAGLMMLRMIEYMEKMPKCGVIMGGSTMIKKIKPHEISVSLKPGWMARGLMVRNTTGLVCDERFMDMAGGGEDDILWYHNIGLGYYPAIMPSFKVTHRANVPKPELTGPVVEGWHKESIRRHPVHGSETLMLKYYQVDQDFNNRTFNEWNNYMQNHLFNKLGVREYDPDYTLDLSYIE